MSSEHEPTSIREQENEASSAFSDMPDYSVTCFSDTWAFPAELAKELGASTWRVDRSTMRYHFSGRPIDLFTFSGGDGADSWNVVHKGLTDRHCGKPYLMCLRSNFAAYPGVREAN